MDGESKAHFAGKEILLLEDDALLGKRLAASLEFMGAEVTNAETLAESRSALEELHFDFALLDLNLPDGLSREEAIAWNQAFEEINGLTVDDGRVTYHGPLHDELARHSPELAAGFHVDDLDRVFAETVALREKLERQKATAA